MLTLRTPYGKNGFCDNMINIVFLCYLLDNEIYNVIVSRFYQINAHAFYSHRCSRGDFPATKVAVHLDPLLPRALGGTFARRSKSGPFNKW